LRGAEEDQIVAEMELEDGIEGVVEEST